MRTIRATDASAVRVGDRSLPRAPCNGTCVNTETSATGAGQQGWQHIPLVSGGVSESASMDPLLGSKPDFPAVGAKSILIEGGGICC